MKIIKSKGGWIRLIEVFVAILLIMGILLVVADRDNFSEKNAAAQVISAKEIAILRDIELNESLRTEIMNVASLPVEWSGFSSGLPNVKSRIEDLSPLNFECEAKLCTINEFCISDGFSGEDIYAESVVISADLNEYSPRQLKLFCSENIV